MQSEAEQRSTDRAPRERGRFARVSAAARGVARFGGHWLRAVELALWTVFFLLAIGFLTLRYWLLPNIERYRDDIVAVVSQEIGQRVSIGAIEPDWRGMLPRLTLADVRVYDASGREALVLPIVENVVSWRSLLHGGLRLHSLAITGPRLTLRRDRQGAIYVAGIRLDDREQGEGRLADWILQQREIEVRNAEIGWIDEMRAAPPLALTQLNFRLRNEDYEHSVGLSARPPAALGSAFEVRAELVGRSVSELRTWNGRIFAELGTTDLAGWRAWVDYPVDVRKGFGAVRVWATLVEGKVRRATADLALTEVVARLAHDLPVLEVASVRGRLQGRDIERGYEFGARNLALSSGRGPDMLSTSFHASWERAANGKPQRGVVNADLLELAPLARLAEFLPFPADLRKTLPELAPQGNLLDVKFDWTGELPEPASYLLKTRFESLAMNAWQKIPGFAGLSGSIDASDARGVLLLAAQKAALELPKVFPEPHLALDSLAGEVHWERAGPSTTSVRIAKLQYTNADLAGTASGTYRHEGAGPGTIDLSAQLTRASAKNLDKYLPHPTLMGQASRGWVASSVLAGQSSDVRLRLKGDLRDFPFTDPAKGQFRVGARFTGGALEYANGWPRIDDIEGELVFERDRMDILGRSGTILGAKISNVRASIPSLLAERRILTVQGNAEGPTAEFFKFIQASPVRRMTDGITDGMSASGAGKLQLRLDLPLGDLPKSKVAGEYQFQANTAQVDPRLPPIERASGRVSFTESSFTVQEARGQLFGGPVAISGGTLPEGGVTVIARGDATVAGLATLFDHPWRARLTGGSPYTATVSVKGGRHQISFESNLRGVASELPPPLAKSAADSLPLRVDIFPAENRDRVSVAVARTLAAEFLRVRQGNEMQVQRTAIWLTPNPGEALRMPERPGTMVYGSLPALDADRWRTLFAGDGPAGGAGNVTSFDLRIGTLDFQGKRLTNVVLRAGADPIGWSANVASAELAGEITYRPEGTGRLVARLSQLRIPPDSPGAKSSDEARQLPAVDLVADNFTHRGKRFGRIELLAQPDGPQWRIDKLTLVNPEASVSGSGAWRSGATSRTALKLLFESSDVGKFLERFGYPGRIQGGKATLEGALAWNGDPLAFDYATLSGELALHAEKGEFPKIETGLGRVLSLFSLSFNDATAKGFAFESISSSLELEKGVVSTRDLKIRGSSAEINIDGDVDLQKETQTLHVKVVPSLRRGVTALATMINPAVGVGIAVAQGILKEPVGKILSYEYNVSGSWETPNIVQLGVQQQSPSLAP